MRLFSFFLSLSFLLVKRTHVSPKQQKERQKVVTYGVGWSFMGQSSSLSLYLLHSLPRRI